MHFSDLVSEEKISMKQVRTVNEPPKPAVRKTKKMVSQTEQEQMLSSKSREMEIQEAQMRTFQQFVQQKKQTSPTHMSTSQSIHPVAVETIFPNQIINLWQTQQLGDDQIVNYDSIDPYVLNEKYSPSAGGKSNRMFPLQMRAHNGLGLSRTMYSKMHDAGFEEFVDCNGDNPFVIDATQDRDTFVDIDIEERDFKQCNEIIFQFMALSR